MFIYPCLTATIFFCSSEYIIEQLESECEQQQHHPFNCSGNDSRFCATDTQVCDGVANCPQGEDEALDLCIEKGRFSDEATTTCRKKNIWNVTIWIKAIPCNGIGECIWDSDELDCSFPDYILILMIAIPIPFFGIFGWLLWNGINLVLPKKQEMSYPDFELLHETDALRERMFHDQSLENYVDISVKMVGMEMKMHDKVISEVVCCIKVRYSKISVPITFTFVYNT